ncbi:MAG: hypothetical protein E6K25_02190 [Gammaproteobacteria bacterium]|nr:MAG: hypothetical protein E6K25_02190 [Gammaproteobacteria bacterium]
MMGAAGFNGALVAALMLASAVGQAADLRVRVDAREVARKRVHTDLTLAVQQGPLTLVFPKWIPGEHGPSGPLESIIALTIRANDAPLPWRRDPRDMYALSVTVPRGATHLEIALDTGLPTEGGHFSTGPTSSEQLAVLPWNEFVLLPKGRDAGTLSTEATVFAPPGWQLICALELRPQADGGVELEPASLARLIDSPLQMGRYAKRIELPGAAPFPELKHRLSLVADSAAALTVPGDFAVGYGRLVQQAGSLFGTRVYRHYTWLLTLSDHVAHFGLEHHESSDDRVDENSLAEAPLREGVADQGLTQFWGTALPVRAGLVTPESYREMLASLAGSFDTEPGNRWRPMADTAAAAQILFSAPDAWTLSRRSVDFYEASVFLWLNVDAELRARSAGRASLDDFVKRFYAGAGGAPALKPYVEADVYATLAAIAPGDWRALIRRHLDTTGTQALLAGLQSAGWQLSYSPERNSYIETRQKRRKTVERQWSIGLRINDKGDDKGTIIDTVEDRAAAQAGAGPGMKIIAVNGRKYSVEVLDAAIAAAHETRKPIELLVESADYYRTLSVAYFDGARYPHLARVDARPDTLAEVLKARTN